MTEVLRIILFISALASALHLSNSQTSDEEDDERLKQVSGRRLFEIERSEISQLGGGSHERYCLCNILIPGEETVFVSEQLNPYKSRTDRLVVYLYKVDGRVNLYIPTAGKQNLLPDLPLEDNDILQEVVAKPLTDLMEDSPYVVSKKQFKDVPDVDFELPKGYKDRYNLYLYKKSLQERLVPYEDPAQNLQFILGNIDRNRLPLSIIAQLQSLLQSKKVGDEYPEKENRTKADYYDSPYKNHSHDTVTDYPFEPTTVEREDENQLFDFSLPFSTIDAAKLTDYPSESSTKLPVNKVIAINPLVYELPQPYPGYETKPSYDQDLEPLLPAWSYPALVDLHSNTSKPPNYEALPLYPGKQSEYHPSKTYIFPYDNRLYPHLKAPTFQDLGEVEFFSPDIVPEKERLVPFGPLEPVSKLPDNNLPTDPKDESYSEPKYFPLVYPTDKPPVSNVPYSKPLEYELPQPYPNQEQQISYNQNLETLLPATKYPEPKYLYSETPKPPNYEAIPLYPFEPSEYHPLGILGSLDRELNPELEVPKLQDQDKLELFIPKSAPGEESLVPIGPLEHISKLQDHGGPVDPKDELPVPNMPSLESLVYELPQPFSGYEKQLSYNQELKPLLPATKYPAPIDLYSHSTKSPNFQLLPFYPDKQTEYLPSKLKTLPYGYELYPNLDSPKFQDYGEIEFYETGLLPEEESSVTFGPLKPVLKSPSKEYLPSSDYDSYLNVKKSPKFETTPFKLFDYAEITDDERPENLKSAQLYLEPSKENVKKFDYYFYPDVETTKFPHTPSELYDFDVPKFYNNDEAPVNLKPTEPVLKPKYVESDYKLYPDRDNSKFQEIYLRLQNFKKTTSYPEREPTKKNVQPLEFELYPDIEPPKFQDTSINLDYVLPTDLNSENLDLSSQFPDFDVLPFDYDKLHFFSEYSLKETTEAPEDSYAFLKFLSSHQLPSWNQLLPQNDRPKAQQLTFDKWFAGELKDIRKPENLNLYTLKITIEKILQENQVKVTEDGILIDKYGEIINAGDLKLRPLLIGKPVGFKNLLNDEGTKKLKLSNASPYLYSLLVSLGSPAKIMGLIPLGVKNPKDSSEEFSENTEPIKALPDYSSGIQLYPSVVQLAKPVSDIHFDINFSKGSSDLPEKSTTFPSDQVYPVTYDKEIDTNYFVLDEKSGIEPVEVIPDFSSTVHSYPSLAKPAKLFPRIKFDIPNSDESFEFSEKSTELPTQTFTTIFQEMETSTAALKPVPVIEFSIVNSDESFELPKSEAPTEFLTPNVYTETFNDIADLDSSAIPNFLPPEVSQLELVSKLLPIEFPDNPDTVEQPTEVSDHPYFTTTEFPYVAEDVALKQLPDVHQYLPVNRALDDSPYFQTTETPYVSSGITYPLHPLSEISSVTLQNKGSPEFQESLEKSPELNPVAPFIASSELLPGPYQPYPNSFEDKTPLYYNLLDLLTGNEPDLQSKILLVFQKYPERFVSTINKILLEYDAKPNLQLKIKKNVEGIVPVLESICVTAQELSTLYPHLHEDFQVLYHILSNKFNIYPNFKTITQNSNILPIDYEIAINEEPYSLVSQPDVSSSPTSGTTYYVTVPDVVPTSRPDYVIPTQYLTKPGVPFPEYTSTSYKTALYEVLIELLSSNEPDLNNQLLLLLEENQNNFVPTLIQILSRNDLNPEYLLKIRQNIVAFIPRLAFAVNERKIPIPNFEIELAKLNTLLFSQPEFSNINFSQYQDPSKNFTIPKSSNPSIQALLELLSRKSQNVNPNLVTGVSTQGDNPLHGPNYLIELFGPEREDLVPVLTQSLRDPKLLTILSKNYPQLDFKLIDKYLNELLNSYGDSNYNYRLQRLINYVYPRITKVQSQLVLPNLSKETLDQILALINSNPSIKVKTEVRKSAEPFQFDGTINKASKNIQKYIVSTNVKKPINNVNVYDYKLGDEAPLGKLFGEHIQLATPRIDFADKLDLNDFGKEEKDKDVPEEQKVEEDLEFRIIGGSAATGSGAPLSNKGRAGIIA